MRQAAVVLVRTLPLLLAYMAVYVMSAVRSPNPVLHGVSRRALLRLEPAPRSAWPRHTAKRLALAAARLRESDGTACNQSTLDAIEA